jgi:hypothetical protein
VIDRIRAVFDQLGYNWVEPYSTTEGAINRGEVGNHRGLYYIYPEKNFYFGKAATNTVINRHQTHRPKLDVDLATLYSTPVEKVEPKWMFPEGWKEGVCKYIIEGVEEIPSHYVKIGKKRVSPGVLDFPVKHKVDVDTLEVLVWNLDHLSADEISAIEEAVIPVIWPYCNNETYRKRKREQSGKVNS